MFGTIQLDVDGIWTIFDYHGINERPDPDPAYTQGLVRFLDIFKNAGIRATLFVIGRDVESPAARKILERALAEGHEIGNHTDSHRCATLAGEEIKRELETAHEKIKDALGVEPRGVRYPGYIFSAGLIEAVREMGYEYDSTIMPTPWAPLLRLTERILSRGEVSLDPGQYGRFFNGIRDVRLPYRPHPDDPLKPGGNGPFEIPLSVSAVLRLPFHSSLSFTLGGKYFLRGVTGLARRGFPVVYPFHAVDLVDAFEDDRLPGYKRIVSPAGARMEMTAWMIEQIKARYDLLTTLDLSARLKASL